MTGVGTAVATVFLCLLWIMANSSPSELAIITDLLAPPSSGETTMHCKQGLEARGCLTSSQPGMWFLIQVQKRGST